MPSTDPEPSSYLDSVREKLDTARVPIPRRVVPVADQPITVDWMTADKVFIKQISIKQKDAVVPQHAHVWDHTSAIAAGAVWAWRGGVFLGRFDAPALIFIEKGAKHTFQTLTENTVIWCIHNALRPDVAAVLDEHELEFDAPGGVSRP